MNKRIKLTIGIGLAVLLLVAALATVAFAQGPGGAFGGGMMGGQGFGGMMGGRGPSSFGGMMGGQGMMGAGTQMTGTMPAGCPFAWDAATAAQGEPLTIDQAAEKAQQYLKSYNNADLALAEVMAFDNNFYAVVTEKSTGMGAFEVLVNRYTGVVHPEPGPNMMWNTKYGHMGMMRGIGGMMVGCGGKPVWIRMGSRIPRRSRAPRARHVGGACYYSRKIFGRREPAPVADG